MCGAKASTYSCWSPSVVKGRPHTQWRIPRGLGVSRLHPPGQCKDRRTLPHVLGRWHDVMTHFSAPVTITRLYQPLWTCELGHAWGGVLGRICLGERGQLQSQQGTPGSLAHLLAAGCPQSTPQATLTDAEASVGHVFYRVLRESKDRKFLLLVIHE